MKIGLDIFCCGWINNAILSQKGDGGKSTLARYLVVELTKQRHKTLLLDLDIQQKTSQEWADLKFTS